MKIMTFNTQHCQNYFEKRLDYGIMAEAINKFAPDFAVLNEMRDTGDAEGFEPQTEILAKMCGMQDFYFAKAIDVYESQKISSPYGNGIISKYKITEKQTIQIPDPEIKTGKRWYESRCILKARLECGITVLGVHVGLNPDEADLAIQTILDNVENEKCIVMGDFNMRPENPIFERFCGRLVDAATKFEGPKLSYPSDVPVKKIDYIFTTPDIEIVSADIPAIVASDHRPHTAQIKF